MQPIITVELLESLGVKIDPTTQTQLIAHLNETLEERVGTEITESLTDDQLAELVSLQEKSDDEAVNTWLTAHVPELGDIIQDEIDILVGELNENSDQLNTTA